MNVLVIGSGGREHALVWAIARSPLVQTVLAMPGNPGTAAEPRTRNVDISPADPEAVLALCNDHAVSLVVIGPEAPLVAGLADRLRSEGYLVIGPGEAGARLEASKDFTRSICKAAGVPMAAGATVTTHAEIDAFCDGFDGAALVVKADGLAAGKGVLVCDSVAEARAAAHQMLNERPFGVACDRIVLEERLQGVETSYIVLTDGERFAPFATSQDHKRLGDGDQGPNTGGMGAFTPADFVTAEQRRCIEEEIIAPVLRQLREQGIEYRGFLYAGVMLTERGPMTLEFNVRLGDPEAQVLLRAQKDDIVPALIAAAEGRLSPDAFGAQQPAAVVVMAAEGYPESPRKGDRIEGLAEAAALDDVIVFHAGTAQADASVVTAGGRVLGVSAIGATARVALERAYEAVERIRWNGVQYRRDIGHHLEE